jgi:hypothetical protein
MQLYQLDDTWDASEFSETYTFDFWAGPQAPICGATIKVRDSDNQDENAPGVV